jgi:hypothetical protein
MKRFHRRQVQHAVPVAHYLAFHILIKNAMGNTQKKYAPIPNNTRLTSVMMSILVLYKYKANVRLAVINHLDPSKASFLPGTTRFPVQWIQE